MSPARLLLAIAATAVASARKPVASAPPRTDGGAPARKYDTSAARKLGVINVHLVPHSFVCMPVDERGVSASGN